MSTQAMMIMDTLRAMQRRCSQDDDVSDFDEPYLQMSNRGNKLKRHARHPAGVPPASKKERPSYTKSVKYAGYRRDVVSRVPRRYDEDGFELQTDEEDEDADAIAADENPYGEIRLEQLLAPLTSPAKLPEHPSLSAPYSSSILSTMTRHACNDIHQERDTLCDAQLLLRKLRGDSTFVPTEHLNAAIDQEIFGVDHVYQTIIAEAAASRPRADSKSSTVPNGHAHSRGTGAQKTGTNVKAADINDIKNDQADAAKTRPTETPPARVSRHLNGTIQTGKAISEEDHVGLLGSHSNKATKEMSTIDPMHIEEKLGPIDTIRTGKSRAAGSRHTKGHIVREMPGSADDDQGTEITPLGEVDRPEAKSPEDPAHEDEVLPDVEPTAEKLSEKGNQASSLDDEADDSRLAPRRMRTRAQAQAKAGATDVDMESQAAACQPRSTHPLFISPASATPDADYGLPPVEAEETRRLLMVYVQKQEEICRSAEKLYQKLLLADRQRKTVVKWCKAEGHVGEMSDGEDWYDKEEWGLKENLKKGQADDAAEDEVVQGKKTRGRRA